MNIDWAKFRANRRRANGYTDGKRMKGPHIDDKRVAERLGITLEDVQKVKWFSENEEVVQKVVDEYNKHGERARVLTDATDGA